MCADGFPIETVLATTEWERDIALLDVLWDEPRLVLLRARSMPEFALLVLAERRLPSRALFQFRLPSDGASQQFSIACMCRDCAIETRDRLPSADENDAVWMARSARMFSEAIASACKRHGVRAVFVRHAEEWEERFPVLDSPVVREVADFQHALSYLYPQERIAQALRFIHGDSPILAL